VTWLVRRILAASAVVSLGAAGLLGVEVQRARISPRDDYGPVLDLGSGTGPKVVWLGDSTASGVGVHRAEDALPRQVATMTGRAEQVISLAVSGARAHDVVAHQVGAVPADASVVVIDIGANDVVHGALTRTYRHQYEEVLARVPRHASVVVLGVPDMGSPPRLDQPLRSLVGWRGRAFDAVVRSLAHGHHLAYVDIAGHTGPSFRHDPARYFAADRYHPNATGYRLWAEAVAPILSQAIARAVADARWAPPAGRG